MRLCAAFAVLCMLPVPAAAAPPGHRFLRDWPGLHRLDPAAPPGTFIVIDIAFQKLYFFRRGTLAQLWPVSTALHGTGERAGSDKTPLGAFVIQGKIGAGLPEFATLSRFGATGGIANPVFVTNDPAASDAITTRILTLQGLEPGWNEGGDVDTLARHIYIHGTADLGQLGTPASQGCVQLAPGAMLDLFRAVSPGTPVLIIPGNTAGIPGMAG